jgi:hypothetical protein
MRVQYPGAIYHLISRGDRRETIFDDDVDRQDFLKTLAETCQKTGSRETTLPTKMIAARVKLGSSKSANGKLHVWLREHEPAGTIGLERPAREEAVS